jgi:hypothetical protein
VRGRQVGARFILGAAMVAPPSFAIAARHASLLEQLSRGRDDRTATGFWQSGDGSFQNERSLR